jgi:YihY family inner membrane protein
MDRHPPQAIRFISRVLRDFFLRNHGLLLSGSVAFNVMLSLIPLCAVLMVAFSRLFDRQLLMDTLTTEVSLIAPGFIPTLTEVLDGFLDDRGVVGGIGLMTLMFFSSKAFRVLEDAFAIIFHRPLPALKRKFWISALLPYLFILIVAGGLILITSVNAVIDARVGILKHFPQVKALVDPYIGALIYLIGFLGLVLLFTLLYKIMPVARVSFGRALAGGFTAAVLWEITRHLLVAYYTHISAVNVIYGSMATIVIVFITMEAAALILLLGAQIIAELQHNADAGLAWHDDPDEAIPATLRHLHPRRTDAARHLT